MEEQEDYKNLLEYEGRESRVVELTENNYDDFVKENEQFLVFYYIPHCKMSEKIGKTLDRVSLILEKEGSQMKVGRMNNVEQDVLINKLNLKNPPPDLIFQKGEERERVKGGHHMSDRQLANEVQIRAEEYPRLVNEQEIASYSGSLKLLYIYVTSQKEIPVEVQEAFTNVHNRDKLLVKVASLNGFQEGQLVVEREGQRWSRPAEDSPLHFIKNTFLGSLVLLDNSVVEYLMDKQGECLLVFVEKNDHLTLATLKEASAIIRQTGLVVVQCETTSKLGRKLANFFKATKLPHAVIADASQAQYAIHMKKYSLRQPITVSNLVQFANQYQQRLLKLENKSEPVEITSQNGINVYVGSNFREGVFRKDKSSFLIIYTPLTALSKILMPVMEKLAQKLEGFDGVQICKIDGDKNGLDGVIHHGYPSIKFISAGSQEAVDYDQDLGTQDLLDYLSINVPGLKQFLDNQKETPKQEL